MTSIPFCGTSRHVLPQRTSKSATAINAKLAKTKIADTQRRDDVPAGSSRRPSNAGANCRAARRRATIAQAQMAKPVATKMSKARLLGLPN